ncbi:hypothetical protein JL722_8966 [Aureococcus anophagefferens]|nr:hypothetical protein JL722_8966 [Aureococcus anophagefferens]
MTLATANAKENESKALAELRAEATRAKDLEDLVSRLQGSLEAASSWDPESHFSAMVRLQESHAAALSEANRDDELAALARSSAAKEAEAKHVVDVYKGEVARLGAADPALVARLEDRAAAAEAVAGALAAAAKEPSDWDSLDGDDTSLELEAARERARREDSRSKAERLALEMELADAEAKVAELKRSLTLSRTLLQADLEVAELRETRSSAAGLFSSSEAALRSEIDALREALRTQADERALDEAAVFAFEATAEELALDNLFDASADVTALEARLAAAEAGAAAARAREATAAGAAADAARTTLRGERRRLRRSRAEADAASDRTWYETVLPSKKPSSTVLGLRRDLEEVKKTARDAVATARELRRARGDDNEASEDESDAEVAFAKREARRDADRRRALDVAELALAPDGVPAVLDEFFASGDSPRRPASGDSPRRPATTPRVTVPGPGPPDYLGELCYAIPAGDGGLARDRRRATAFGDGLLQRQPFPLFA